MHLLGNHWRLTFPKHTPEIIRAVCFQFLLDPVCQLPLCFLSFFIKGIHWVGPTLGQRLLSSGDSSQATGFGLKSSLKMAGPLLHLPTPNQAEAHCCQPAELHGLPFLQTQRTKPSLRRPQSKAKGLELPGAIQARRSRSASLDLDTLLMAGKISLPSRKAGDISPSF